MQNSLNLRETALVRKCSALALSMVLWYNQKTRRAFAFGVSTIELLSTDRDLRESHKRIRRADSDGIWLYTHSFRHRREREHEYTR